jgi:hypothetical protein
MTQSKLDAKHARGVKGQHGEMQTLCQRGSFDRFRCHRQWRPKRALVLKWHIYPVRFRPCFSLANRDLDKSMPLYRHIAMFLQTTLRRNEIRRSLA